MPVMKNANVRGILVLAGITLVTAAIGLATTAQLAARNSQATTKTTTQDPPAQGQGERRGPGMMGHDMMGGPGGPGMRGGRGGGPFGMFGPELRALELTDAQRQQVRTIMESHKDEHEAMAAKMEAARKALHDAITADTVNEAAIRARAADVAVLDADAAVLQARVHAEVVAILTPEQLKKAKELRSEMENRMREGRGAMRQRHQPRPEPRADDEANWPETV